MSKKYYYTFNETQDVYAIYLSPQVIRGLLEVLIFLFAIIILIFYRRQLYNFWAYKNKKFTEEKEIIDFVKQFCPNFKNSYSIKYQEGDILLDREELPSELSEIEYKNFVSREIIIEKVSWLFDRYQQDRMARNFKAIAEYTLEPFTSKHKYIGDLNIYQKIDIRYQYKIFKIIPLKFEIREELNRFIVQINGRMIGFQVSEPGYVLKGRSQLLPFREYWDIALGGDNKGYIVTIY